MIPVLHFQFMNSSGVARKIVQAGKPFVASIVPNLLDKEMKTEEGKDIHERIHLPRNYYPDWAVEFFRDNRDNPHITWVQEGYRHCCGRCYDLFEKHGG